MNTNSDCIFCKILAKEIPSCIVNSSDAGIAFLDLAPFEKGHTLVIPRHHAAYITELPESALQELMPLVQDTARKIMKALNCDGFNILQNNGACATQTVPHVHFHIIPRWNNKDISWEPSKYESKEEMQEMANRILNA